ncbi:Uncharacterised protein [Scardovia inopinata]|uniref:Arylsulfotransferase N-terminal domain-containing protein n=1 Tax=Scardovia inopinata F0304 TaxID=641146 RepID=W5IJH9_SCAIO|nr:hypothetical protein [Scardovia inopinata]EFG27050.1 hypothetical protein HMPREF9020_00682 [Scardovia inopinata F0304]BAR06661.1 hypothetical protein SCIP_0594 [Scardovia inopinata JCM 12537]SUV52227.1 Uncharacterised protein [Scardovia inopinata]
MDTKIVHRKLVQIIAVLSALAFLFSCCSACGLDRFDKKSFEKINLKEYQYALFISPQWTDDDGGKIGYLLLIKPNGQYLVQRQGSMDNGSISWTKNSLFYTDSKRDYWLSDSRAPHRVPSEKFYLQDGLVTLADGVTRVGVYNGGYSNSQHTDYDEQIVISDTHWQSHRFRSHFQYSLVAACGNDVYGLTTDDSLTSKVFDKSVDRIVQNKRFSFKKVMKYTDPLGESGPVTGKGSCANNRIVFLGSHSRESGEKIRHTEVTKKLLAHQQKDEYGKKEIESIEVINVQTGEWKSLPLINKDHTTFLSNRFGFDYSVQTYNSLNKGYLYWIHGDGRILKTDMKSGVTTVVSTILHNTKHKIEDIAFHPTVIKNRMVVLVEDWTKPDRDITIYTIDLKTGTKVSQVSIKGLEKKIADNMILRGFAVRP